MTKVAAPFDAKAAVKELLALDAEVSLLMDDVRPKWRRQGAILLQIQEAKGRGKFYPWCKQHVRSNDKPWSERKIRYLMDYSTECDNRERRGEPLPEHYYGSRQEIAESNKGQQQAEPQKVDPFVEAARKVFGGTIDLSPTTSSEANEGTVKAKKIFDSDEQALAESWHGTVWLELVDGDDRRFAEKLIQEYLNERVEAAVLSIEVARLREPWFPPLWDQPVCIAPMIVDEQGKIHSSAIYGRIYFGPHEKQFAKHFIRFGPIFKWSDCGYDPIYDNWDETPAPEAPPAETCPKCYSPNIDVIRDEEAGRDKAECLDCGKKFTAPSPGLKPRRKSRRVA